MTVTGKDNIIMDKNNTPRKYVQINGKGPTYCLHGTSSINAFEALQQRVESLEEENRILHTMLDLPRLEDLDEIQYLRRRVQELEKERQALENGIIYEVNLRLNLESELAILNQRQDIMRLKNESYTSRA